MARSGKKDGNSASRDVKNPRPLMSDVIAGKASREFSGLDFSYLSENENFRYARNSKHVAHAVIGRNRDGEKIAVQYALPEGTRGEPPKVCSIQDVEEITRFGMTRYRAKGEDGKTWYAKRFDHARVKLDDDDDAMSVDLAYFSEEEDDKEPFWGSNASEPKFSKVLSRSNRKDFNIELEEIGVNTKGGVDMTIDSKSVHYRDVNHVRKPDQNTLMGESARDAYEEFHGQWNDVITPEFSEILERAFTANLYGKDSQFRPEWLHAYGFSLVPREINPQQKSNLGAAAKWANTEMMVLERIAKWFALHQTQDTNITIKTLFDMLLDSELINTIHFEVNVEVKSRFIRFIQDLDVFKKYPLFRKASDLAQATGISYAMLHQHPPLRREKVIGAPIIERKPVQPASPQSDMSAVQHLSGDSVMPKSGENVVSGEKGNKPSKVEFKKSTVQVLASGHTPDYEEPWHGTSLLTWRGSGFVIENEGKKYVVTNAHCVENQIRTRIRLADNRDIRFDAKPICVSYQSDLALLEIADPAFQDSVEAVTLGKMVKAQKKVKVVGFPRGGNELSITKGIASRIEAGYYCMSGSDMLHVQIDAPINPGNSGGPVFDKKGRVAGVAFQGDSSGEGLGYIIPAPIVEHFLKEAFSGKDYRGYPILSADLDTLENQYQREFYGMTKEETGMLVSDLSPLSDANRKLKKGDVLLEIDGNKISNDGKVNLPGIGDCIDMRHVTHMKFIGDSVHLKVLRKNAEGKPERLDVEVILDHVPGEAEAVGKTEHDKVATYYLNSGMVFVPVTRNFLEGPGSDLEEMLIVHPDGKSFYLADKPKTNPEQQLVAINNVLDCKSTEGYEDDVFKLVKKVNGKEINNLADLIEAMESNHDKVHVIETTDKTIVLKNLSRAEMKKVMDEHKIYFDRSEDLRAGMDCSSVEDDEMSVIASEASEDSCSEVSDESEAEQESRKRSLEKTILSNNGLTPGQAHYGNVVGKYDAMIPKEFWDNPNDLSDEDYAPPPRKSQRVSSNRDRHSFFSSGASSGSGRAEHAHAPKGMLR